VFVASLEMFSRRRGLSERKYNRSRGKVYVSLITSDLAPHDMKCLQVEIYSVVKT